MRNQLDGQLEQLNVELIQMGALCEDAISAAVGTLIQDEEALADKARLADSKIDRKEREIEGLCMKLLLSQQPVAGDLRVISSALKMISDMERIGDQASDIAEIAGFLRGNGSKSRVHISEMAQAASKMVTASVDSFVKQDLNLARKVQQSDDKVDGLFSRVKEELIGLIGKDSSRGEACLDLLMIAKYLERIGDHAVNIAEWVEYSITGQHREKEQEKV